MIEPVCSDSSLAADEPLIGSAPLARTWLCLEQGGPWGAKALTDSHLDRVLGARIEQATATHGIRPALIRRPGRHADDHRRHNPMVLVAHTDPANPWLHGGRLGSPEQVLELDLAAIAAGQRPEQLPALTDEVLLVCTNGSRDTCCARLGRPVALAAAHAHPGRVWEVTHSSGHRFAPTTVLLPSGHLHGRLLGAADVLAAADRGTLVLDGWRGRSTWPAQAQVAEELVRRASGLTGLHDLSVAADDDTWLVTAADGRRWRVRTETAVSGERAESCGKEPKPVRRVSGQLVS
ncbi:sucrase ferredoxin [Nocardioides terrisoli]|uniref:sucrase ferredoxin n=1 Tax=Nocardioides terrisoli TaxID=3388267 RepID=UPI00287BAB85|nr:sucrase ferredoxin [Nocardioides marmorisolisilvae]